jgi:nucleotide-binding universal stress UspA family protein
VRPILVPIDDPGLTTCLLWHVEPILHWERPRVVLLESGQASQGDEPTERLGRLLQAGGVKASVEHTQAPLADAVLEQVRALDPELVLVATGSRRSTLAERLLRTCSAPLFLFNPDTVTSRFRRILVPLDGSERSARIVPLVAWLGSIYGSHVVLLHVAPEEPGDDDGVDLSASAEWLEAVGLKVSQLVARDRDPAQAILAAAELETADMVAMTTHGRSALDHWAFGSVAEKVFHACKVPLLVRRVAGPLRPHAPAAKPDGWGEQSMQTRQLDLRRVLVPVDGSTFSERAVRVIPRILDGKEVEATLFRVLPEMGAEISTPGVLTEAREALDLLQADLAALGWAFETRVVVGDAATRIVAAAREEQADLIVMASHCRMGASRWIRGSVAERVLRRSDTPVLICPPRWLETAFWDEGGIHRILVTLDGSEQAAAVLPLAEDLAARHGAELVLLRVGAALPGADERTLAKERRLLAYSLEDERQRIASAGIAVTVRIALGDPVEEILIASNSADLVAMTTHGRSGPTRWLLGSVAERVLRACHRPLLLVRNEG